MYPYIFPNWTTKVVYMYLIINWHNVSSTKRNETKPLLAILLIYCIVIFPGILAFSFYLACKTFRISLEKERHRNIFFIDCLFLWVYWWTCIKQDNSLKFQGLWINPIRTRIAFWRKWKSQRNDCFIWSMIHCKAIAVIENMCKHS